jgi:uncharacterized repeat protein (TIGR01451 family)
VSSRADPAVASATTQGSQPRPGGGARAPGCTERSGRRLPLLLGGALIALSCLLGAGARAAMVGYATNATGIYRVNTQTGAVTLLYSGAPFNGSTFAAGAALRPSDGMLFFTFNNVSNQPVYRWDPLTPAVAPVLLGTTGAGRPYIHRLAFHPTSGVLYGSDINGANLWQINQGTGAATNAGALTGIPANTSGDIAFNPVDGLLYAPIQASGGTTATIYRLPLGGGAVVNVGTITGLSTGGALNSAMFGPTGTLYVGGDSAILKTAPLPGGAAATVGSMGITPQDFASAPAPDPVVTKSFSPSTVGPNTNSTLTLTLSNSFAQPLRGAAITDTYPSGTFVNAPVPGAGTTCGGTVTAAAGDSSVSLTGGTIPANGSCTITVSVRAAAAGTYVNAVPAGSLTTLLATSSAAASATLTVSAASLTIVKSLQVVSDPVNGAINPKAIPGADVLYTLNVANTGAGAADNNTVAVVDPVPANTRLFLGDLGGAGSGPVAFVDGSPASGLTWTYTALASGTDDLEFSDDGGATWTHTPSADGSGYDTSGITHVRMRPKGTMAGNSGGGNPTFLLRFRVRIN